MNRIDFTKTGGILRSQDLFNYLQQSYTELFAGIAAMVGNNVIVAGVTDLGSTYSNGWVVINGELLPFVGGTKAAQIIVNETIDQEAYGDGANKDAYYTRVAQCASTGGTNVSSFFRLPELTQFATTSAMNSAIATAIANLINSAPGALDTLKELADALGDNPNFATTITNLISTETTNRTNAVNAEAITRGNADTTLQTNINNEATTRGNADTTLQTNIDNEATTRASEDAKLVQSHTGLNIGTADLNTLITPIDTVLYYASSFGPSNGWGSNFDKYYKFSVFVHSGNLVGQTAIGLNVAKIMSRVSTNGGSSWSAWQTVV